MHRRVGRYWRWGCSPVRTRQRRRHYCNPWWCVGLSDVSPMVTGHQSGGRKVPRLADSDAVRRMHGIRCHGSQIGSRSHGHHGIGPSSLNNPPNPCVRNFLGLWNNWNHAFQMRGTCSTKGLKRSWPSQPSRLTDARCGPTIPRSGLAGRSAGEWSGIHLFEPRRCDTAGGGSTGRAQ